MAHRFVFSRIINISAIPALACLLAACSNETTDVEVAQASLELTAQAPVQPLLECIEWHGFGIFTARYGYENPNSETIEIELGPRNSFWPKEADRGQPTSFAPGKHAAAFNVDFDGWPLFWFLDGGLVAASYLTPLCQK